MKTNPILPMLNNSEQIITDSLKNIVETRILCLHIIMCSDTGNTMEDEFCRSAGSQMAPIQHGRHEIIPGWQYDNPYHCRHTGGST